MAIDPSTKARSFSVVRKHSVLQGHDHLRCVYNRRTPDCRRPPWAGTDARPTLQRRPRVPPLPGAGQARHQRHQAAGEPARPLARLLPGRGRSLRRDRRRPRRGGEPHRPLEPRRGGDERHRGAGPRLDRAARGQARHGRQGGAVQEVLRHRRVRRRDRRAGPGALLRRGRESRTHLRGDQPRRRQGAGVLRDRIAARLTATLRRPESRKEPPMRAAVRWFARRVNIRRHMVVMSGCPGEQE